MWESLSNQEKINFKKLCDSKYGETICFSETGEPLYFDENGFMIDTQILLDLLFSNTNN
jgi:hypothetical protein